MMGLRSYFESEGGQKRALEACRNFLGARDWAVRGNRCFFALEREEEVEERPFMAVKRDRCRICALALVAHARCSARNPHVLRHVQCARTGSAFQEKGNGAPAS